jgi:hypothetical protein
MQETESGDAGVQKFRTRASVSQCNYSASAGYETAIALLQRLARVELSTWTRLARTEKKPDYLFLPASRFFKSASLAGIAVTEAQSTYLGASSQLC